MLIGLFTTLTGLLMGFPLGRGVMGATVPQVRLRLAKLLPSPEQRGPRGGAMNLFGRVA